MFEWYKRLPVWAQIAIPLSLIGVIVIIWAPWSKGAGGSASLAPGTSSVPIGTSPTIPTSSPTKTHQSPTVPGPIEHFPIVNTPSPPLKSVKSPAEPTRHTTPPSAPPVTKTATTKTAVTAVKKAVTKAPTSTQLQHTAEAKTIAANVQRVTAHPSRPITGRTVISGVNHPYVPVHRAPVYHAPAKAAQGLQARIRRSATYTRGRFRI